MRKNVVAFDIHFARPCLLGLAVKRALILQGCDFRRTWALLPREEVWRGEVSEVREEVGGRAKGFEEGRAFVVDILVVGWEGLGGCRRWFCRRE